MNKERLIVADILWLSIQHSLKNILTWKLLNAQSGEMATEHISIKGFAKELDLSCGTLSHPVYWYTHTHPQTPLPTL